MSLLSRAVSESGAQMAHHIDAHFADLYSFSASPLLVGFRRMYQLVKCGTLSILGLENCQSFFHTTAHVRCAATHGTHQFDRHNTCQTLKMLTDLAGWVK